jgi:hypothetical protein
MKYAIYTNDNLFHVCSTYVDTIPVTDWAIKNGYRTRCEEVSEYETRVIFDASNGNISEN